MGADGDPKISIVRGEARHAEELASLAARTFRAAFGAENTDSDMESYLAREFSRARVAEELEDRSNVFLLARSAAEGRALGYAKLRPGALAESAGGDRPIELQRLYLETGVVGMGLGAALMEACLERAAAGGHDELWLGVWERNERAIAFYRRWGFREVGEHRFVLGSPPQRDLVMVRSLAPAVD